MSQRFRVRADVNDLWQTVHSVNTDSFDHATALPSSCWCNRVDLMLALFMLALITLGHSLHHSKSIIVKGIKALHYSKIIPKFQRF